MHEGKAKTIVSRTEEIHDDVTEIYELLMDGEDEEGIKKIDKTIAKLRHLKSNLVIKDVGV